MCPAATKLSNTLQFVKASYCRGRDRYGEERIRWPLCPSYLPSFPSRPNLKSEIIWSQTVNGLVMVAKPTDINQSIRFSVPCFYQRSLATSLLLQLINWPSCYPGSEAYKNLIIMVKCVFFPLLLLLLLRHRATSASNTKRGANQQGKVISALTWSDEYKWWALTQDTINGVSFFFFRLIQRDSSFYSRCSSKDTASGTYLWCWGTSDWPNLR